MAVLSRAVSNTLGFSFHGTLSCSSQWSIPHNVLPFGSQMPLSEEIAACVAFHCWGFSISDCNQVTDLGIRSSLWFLLMMTLPTTSDFQIQLPCPEVTGGFPCKCCPLIYCCSKSPWSASGQQQAQPFGTHRNLISSRPAQPQRDFIEFIDEILNS